MVKKEKCFCSFCKNERTYIKKKHIGLVDILFAGLAASLLTFIFWQKLDPRLMLMWVVLALIGEILVHFRWRFGLICSYCGFDPVLYLKDPEKMSALVSKFMEGRKEDPNYVLSNKRFDKLSTRKNKEKPKEIGS